MNILILEEKWEGRSTQYRGNDWVRGLNIQRRTHVRVWYCETDSYDDMGVDNNTQEALNLALEFTGPNPVPGIGEVHPSDNFTFVSYHEVMQNQNTPTVFEIRVYYEVLIMPSDEPAVLNWGDNALERVLEGAVSYFPNYPTNPADTTEWTATHSPFPNLPKGSLYPITNSVFDTFIPPPTEPEHFRVLTVVKNFLLPQYDVMGTGSNLVDPSDGFDPKMVDAYYSRRTNSKPFVVPGVADPFPVDTVFLATSPTARWEFRNMIAYYATTWTFWIRARGWWLLPADMGFRQFENPGAGNYSPIPIYAGGNIVQNQVPLDGAGRMLNPPRQVPRPLRFLKYRKYFQADFNQLRLFDGL